MSGVRQDRSGVVYASLYRSTAVGTGYNRIETERKPYNMYAQGRLGKRTTPFDSVLVTREPVLTLWPAVDALRRAALRVASLEEPLAC
jgi:hypothetical protein